MLRRFSKHLGRDLDRALPIEGEHNLPLKLVESKTPVGDRITHFDLIFGVLRDDQICAKCTPP
jgi:hypothetical protein